MLTHDMTQRLFDNLTPEQKHDAWLAAQAVGAIPPSTPDPATLDENGDLYVDPDSEVIEDPDDYADPLDEDADDEPAPADDEGEPAVSGKGTPRVGRFRNRRRRAGQAALVPNRGLTVGAGHAPRPQARVHDELRHPRPDRGVRSRSDPRRRGSARR